MPFTPQTSTRTAAEVISEVRRTLGDTAGVLFSDIDALAWINAAQREIAKDLELFGEAEVSLVADEAAYVIPVEISQRIRDIQTLLVDGRRLEPVSYVQAQDRWMRPGGEGFPVAGTPTHWFARNQSVTLVPAPDADAATGTMTVQFTRTAVDLTAAASPLDVPDTRYNAVVAYVRYRAYLLTQETELATLSLQEMQNDTREQTRRERRTQNNTNFTLEDDPENY
jgi:hypothetical protein